jgi:hypothetical protein
LQNEPFRSCNLRFMLRPSRLLAQLYWTFTSRLSHDLLPPHERDITT